MASFTEAARRNIVKGIHSADNARFEENAFTFDFDLGTNVDGIEIVEQRIEDRMNEVINEELEKFCLNCQTDKMYDEEQNSYYCPECDV